MSGTEEDRTVRSGPQANPPRVGSEVERLLTVVDLDIELDAHAQALERLRGARNQIDEIPPEERFALERRAALCLLRLGRREEARLTARAALDAAPLDLPSVDRARCLLVAGSAGLELGNLPGARADATAILEALGEGSTLEEAGMARNLLGAVAFRSGEPEAARDHWEKAIEIFRKRGDLGHLAGSYVNLGNLHKLRCDWDRSAEHYHVAYYLGTTRGEYGLVAGAAQNLGIVLGKTGRYREARTYVERGLKLAVEMADPVRMLRARLALARIDRAELLTSRARKLLTLCRSSDPLILPEREHCLLLLEEARLDLEEGSLERARTVAAELRLRVEAMAPRGDLKVEVLLLEADMAAAEVRWQEAETAASAALDSSREDRDRAQEERALLRLAAAWARLGRLGEAETTLSGLAQRHRSRGEWPALAATLKVQGNVALDVSGNPVEALEIYRQTAEVYRRIDLTRAESLAEVARIGCLIKLQRRDEALSAIDAIRLPGEGEEPFHALSREIVNLTAALRECGSGGTSDLLDGLRVHEKLEEILVSPGSAWARLHEILALLRDAIEVDGTLLAQVSGGDLEILASTGIERAAEKKIISARVLGLEEGSLEEARLQIDLDGANRGQVGSRLTIPMVLRGRPHLLYLERRPGTSPVPLGRAERNYAMVLAAEVTRRLDLETPENEGTRLSDGIALADVITQDPRMLKILDLIRRIGDTTLSVLLQGETGTGKKLLAHAIHRASGRRNRAFVTVDCAALPDSLLEAELFGYRKGAFTGAAQDRTGLLAEAAGGTVFLDEIDKAGLPVQRRFLHLLDSGEIRPVGSTSYQRLDVRIVCATSSPDLRSEVAEGLFLKDLYYRLNDISIEVPTLHERKDDILLLAGCFVEMYAGQIGRKIRGMTGAFRRALLAHDWPGNVRELEKAIRRAVTLADDDVLLTPELLPREVTEKQGETSEETGDDLRGRIESFERRAIENALDACGGNKSRAAQTLGLSRKGLKGKIARYRIGRDSAKGD
jgi:DNA-binding NtrC family response regulator/tetratricopeptide (TPR) repeat protein